VGPDAFSARVPGMSTAARTDLAWLAEEQAALRRVATLVAGAPDPPAVFDAVTKEASRLLDLPVLTLVRFDPDRTASIMAAATQSPFPVGFKLELDGPSVIATILETGRAARVDSYEGMPGTVAAGLRAAGARAGYGVPIVVNGTVWGAMTAVQSGPQDVPEDAEARLANFTELIATAIANAQARDDLSRLAAEQASLRRVATLVARGSAGEGLFSAVAAEVQKLFDVPDVAVVRYEGGEVVVVGAAGGNPFIPRGGRWSLDGPSVSAQVRDSGRPARIDGYGGLSGVVAEIAERAGFESVAGAPIVVDGRVWGAIVVVSSSEPLPDHSEVRVAEYTELVATAISNAATDAELIASRARIVAASDEARRRVERYLHDGIQQRLIALALDVRTLRGSLPENDATGRAGLDRLQDDVESVLDEVREISRGLHPALLARRGLRAPLQSLARRSPIAVELRVEGPRLPESVEVATYYAVSEALTNAIKHSQASLITIEVESADGVLRATVEDDGVGGAVIGDGTGLSGLIDRIDALGGTFTVASAASGGTRVEIHLPSARAAP
jgi:signal transduction histidine kinase